MYQNYANSIGTIGFVRYIEAVRSWEGLLWEVLLYLYGRLSTFIWGKNLTVIIVSQFKFTQLGSHCSISLPS